MESFLREPSRLVAEQQRIQNEMVDVSMRYYPVFIQSTKSCSEVLHEIDRDVQTAERLKAEDEELRQSLHQLYEKGEAWKKGRQKLLILRSSQEKLKDLFELPNLLESCLRNELYFDAVVLHEKVESLLEAAPDIPILQFIGKEVEVTMQRHLPQIISKLSSALTPAQCVKVTRILKKLPLFSDTELRKLFLTRRLAYLQSLLRDIQKNTFTYLSRVCNVIGMYLPAIITEYRSSFEDEPNTLSAADTAYDTPVCDTLGSWLNGVVDDFLLTFRQNLLLVTSGGEIKTLLEQAMQCSHRLSKQGVDISPIIFNIFCTRITDLWKQGMESSYSSFTLALGNHQWRVASHAMKSDPHSIAPPQILRQYLPLGYLVNGYLNTLNEIRRCALVSLTPLIAAKATEMLTKAVGEVVEIFDSTPFDQSELTSYLSFAKVMIDDLLPYIARCTAMALDHPSCIPVKEIAKPLVEIHRQHARRATPSKEEVGLKRNQSNLSASNTSVASDGASTPARPDPPSPTIPDKHPEL